MSTQHPGLRNGPIYLDYNATTPVDPAVVEAMLPYLALHFGNPSSTHRYGHETQQAVTIARTHVAQLLGCVPSTIVFTGGGSESDNLAIRGVALAKRHRGNQIITQVTEHPAVLNICHALERHHGFRITYLPVDAYGRVNPADVAEAINEQQRSANQLVGFSGDSASTTLVVEVAGMATEDAVRAAAGEVAASSRTAMTRNTANPGGELSNDFAADLRSWWIERAPGRLWVRSQGDAIAASEVEGPKFACPCLQKRQGRPVGVVGGQDAAILTPAHSSILSQWLLRWLLRTRSGIARDRPPTIRLERTVATSKPSRTGCEPASSIRLFSVVWGSMVIRRGALQESRWRRNASRTRGPPW